MKIKRFLAFAMALLLAFSLGGCRNRGEDEPDVNPDITTKDELVLYHESTAVAPMLMSLAEEYSAATGKSAAPHTADLISDLKAFNVLTDSFYNAKRLVTERRSRLSSLPTVMLRFFHKD